ncbi:hypothetical protein HGRIS_003721 [Hohenbuehelia grisea]|uniref:J domain-containing protein n=1 Tax=Hohenbuehelia grisea TaxID=104357 RepID=A0ABR3JGS0_9AGAR
MFSYVLSSASAYFHLPVDEAEDEEIDSYSTKYLTYGDAGPSGSKSSYEWSGANPRWSPECDHSPIIKEIVASNDLYAILDVERTGILDKVTLRRAYLRRSRACHPEYVSNALLFSALRLLSDLRLPHSKYPNNTDATFAFQKVSVAYEILSKPTSRHAYDARSPSAPYDYFAARPTAHSEQTFRNVVLGAFNDFLDGDLEVIRTILKTINDINPALKLGDEGINSVLLTLQSIREQALTCRTCIYALHAEITRLIEVQHAFRQLSYFDLMGRSRLTIRLTRITLSLPFALEKALREQSIEYASADEESGRLLPRRIFVLLRGIDGALARMERLMKK